MKTKKTKTSSLELKRNSPRKRDKYAMLFKSLAKLKRGENILVSCEKGQSARQLQNALLMALRYNEVVPASKTNRFSCRLTEADDVAVCCVSKS